VADDADTADIPSSDGFFADDAEDADPDEGDDAQPSQTEPSRTREKSTIKFPYNDLDDVVKLANALHERRGGRARLSELAAAVNQAPTSGSFRLRVSAARMFGLLNLQNKEVTLTPLGKAVIDHGPGAALARVEAFLMVPLYGKIYAEFSDSRLPDDVGLEARLQHFGVTRNQTSRARQVFARSADQAGFFETAGRTRLIKPSVGHRDGPTHEEPTVEPELDDVAVTSLPPVDESDPLSNPILKGVLQMLLPPIGKPFPAAGRRQLFTALAVNLDVVYGPAPDGYVDYREIDKLVAHDRQPKDPE
jgi:hypothetical protein